MGLKSHLYLGLIITLLFVDTADAEKLYKYKDENGVWHFSDQHPDTAQSVEIKQIRVSDLSKKLTVQSAGTKSEQFIYVLNDYQGPVEVEIKLMEGKNIATDPLLPARIVIPAEDEVKAVRLWPVQPQKTWTFQFNYRFVFGDPKAKHIPQKPYRLPFEEGRAFNVTQGFHGSYSHNEPHSEYAVDIAMPEGTKIYFARSGVVMDLADDFIVGGTDMDEYKKRANSIRILHDDGTMAIYGHLKLETAQVFAGKEISEGQFIAKLGSTGFSSGPHLHFVVQKNTGMKLVSIPFQFEGTSGGPITPELGMVLGNEKK